MWSVVKKIRKMIFAFLASILLSTIVFTNSKQYSFNGIDYTANIHSDTTFGYSCSNYASNCSQVLCNTEATSGHYWVKSGEAVERVYCAFSPRECGGEGVWRRVGLIDMSAKSAKCPGQLRLTYQNKKAFCQSGNSRCLSAFFPADIAYSEVCGMVRGYQALSTDAFYRTPPNPPGSNSQLTPDHNYVDGVSFTYGAKPRKHVWTYASAYSGDQCSDPPPFIGTHYYCETSYNRAPQTYTLFNFQNPLWDGEGHCAGPTCGNPNQPWFRKVLPNKVSEDLEIRLCADQQIRHGALAIDYMELYIRED